MTRALHRWLIFAAATATSACGHGAASPRDSTPDVACGKAESGVTLYEDDCAWSASGVCFIDHTPTDGF